MQELRADVGVIGGGFGGVAAALALLDRGHSVVMTEEFPWIGGQVSSQGLCVLDDINVADRIGSSRRYHEFRSRVRSWYTARYTLSDFGRIQTDLCPGNARCSHLSAEPNAAHDALRAWLTPAVASGRLTVLTGMVPVEALRRGQRIERIVCSGPAGRVAVDADFFLDGTEAGDTFPLLGLPFRIGAEAQAEFGEAHAPPAADPQAVQSFTYCLLVEFVPGGDFTIAKPPRYEHWRDRNGFFLSSAGATREEPAYFLKPRILRNGARIVPFWNYRSVLDPFNFAPGQARDRTVINVSSNDYHDRSYLAHPRPQEVLAEARELTAAYLYWLQTEAPRDEGGRGYPEIRPLPEATGTPDGIAQAPYVREGRRLKAEFTITEQHISAASQAGPRAACFQDSIGLGGYAIDIHGCPGLEVGTWQPTRPYQIPLGSLVSPEIANFAVAGKAIGVSHIANGAYRLHPEEWAIGEAAGALASFCLRRRTPRPRLSGAELFAFQRDLIRDGVPVYWFEDLTYDGPGFEAAQTLAISGLWPGSGEHLRFDAQRGLGGADRTAFLAATTMLEGHGIDIAPFRERMLNSHDIRKHDLTTALMRWLDLKGWGPIGTGPGR